MIPKRESNSFSFFVLILCFAMTTLYSCKGETERHAKVNKTQKEKTSKSVPIKRSEEESVASSFPTKRSVTKKPEELKKGQKVSALVKTPSLKIEFTEEVVEESYKAEVVKSTPVRPKMSQRQEAQVKTRKVEKTTVTVQPKVVVVKKEVAVLEKKQSVPEKSVKPASKLSVKKVKAKTDIARIPTPVIPLIKKKQEPLKSTEPVLTSEPKEELLIAKAEEKSLQSKSVQAVDRKNKPKIEKKLTAKRVVKKAKEATLGVIRVNSFLNAKDLILAATDNGIYVSKDDGTTWKQTKTPLHKVRGRKIPRKMNITFKKGEMYYIGGEGGVWFSKKPEVEWRKHSTGLNKKIIVNTINYDHSNNKLLIGTNDGVFSRDTWGSWSKMSGTNLPYNTVVKNIIKYESLDGERLAIGTNANGIWFWHKNEWRQFSTWVDLSKIGNYGMPYNLANINSLYFERMTNTLWAASTTGVNWKGVNFEGTWEELEFEKNFFSSNVIVSSPDHAQLYIGTSNGMFHIPLEEFSGLISVKDIEPHLVEGTLGKDITAITVLEDSILYSSDKGIGKILADALM